MSNYKVIFNNNKCTFEQTDLSGLHIQESSTLFTY